MQRIIMDLYISSSMIIILMGESASVNINNYKHNPQSRQSNFNQRFDNYDTWTNNYSQDSELIKAGPDLNHHYGKNSWRSSLTYEHHRDRHSDRHNSPLQELPWTNPKSKDTTGSLTSFRSHRQIVSNLISCLGTCPVTSEYSPVCGTDSITYSNLGRLECAQFCGVDVKLQRKSACSIIVPEPPLHTQTPELQDPQLIDSTPPIDFTTLQTIFITTTGPAQPDATLNPTRVSLFGVSNTAPVLMVTSHINTKPLGNESFTIDTSSGPEPIVITQSKVSMNPETKSNIQFDSDRIVFPSDKTVSPIEPKRIHERYIDSSKDRTIRPTPVSPVYLPSSGSLGYKSPHKIFNNTFLQPDSEFDEDSYSDSEYDIDERSRDIDPSLV